MNYTYNDQGYSPQNPGFFQNPNVPATDTQTMAYLQNIATSQANTNGLLLQTLQRLEFIQAGKEMARIRKEQEVYDNEEAFSRIEQTSQGLVVYGKNRYQHVICPVRIEYIFHIQLDRLYHQESFYIVYFLNIDQPIFILKKTLADPDALRDAISGGIGRVIPCFGGSKKTGQMLRNYLTANAKEIYIPFYGGWQKKGDRYTFSLINGSTHGNADLFDLVYASLPTGKAAAETLPTASATLTMVQQITQLMETFTSPDLRSLLFTWVHAAFLCSLLVDLKYPVSQGLCLYSSDSRVLNVLKLLMSWYDDTTVSADLPPAEFANRIIAHKDQPITILDPVKNNKNVEFLLSAMSTGQIPADQHHGPLKMQALPTAISGHLGPLSYSPNFILVEISACDLKNNSFEMLSRLRKYLPDYLMAFAAHTSSHIEELILELENAICSVHSNCPADCPMSQDGLNTLGVLTGIQKFVWNFHKDLAPSSELLNKLRILSPQKPSALLTDALYKSSDYADSSTAIASQFCAITSRWINDGKLEVRKLNGSCVNKPNHPNLGLVYIDSEAHYLTRIAFTAICKATGNSSPSVLRALSDIGILEGSKTHDATFQTRKTIASRTTAVYKLDSALVDEYSIIER